LLLVQENAVRKIPPPRRPACMKAMKTMNTPSSPLKSAEETFLFPGRATDTDVNVLAAGAGDANTAYLGFSARSETGQDVEYIRWHLYDHVPEQPRIPAVRNGQRWVSTPECRAARRAQEAPFDRADHAVQYLFAEPAVETLKTFMELGRALAAAGRQPLSLPRLQSGAYAVVDRRANPRGTLGAYAVPWRPASGIYLTVETMPPDNEAWAAHSEALGRLVELDGVTGAWRYAGYPQQLPFLRSDPSELVTVFYLYGDPVATAGPLGDLLERQWEATGRRARFAAPFHVVCPTDLDRYLP
jgi:hypothetical protein